ncbi:hypothetical protein KSP40_PGU021237 [Platanthera guangdongensis]|uniref:FLZ-type domain-containing protein n=1 Tax=Platanthera guangdongensis TaxID=2320717 RepID=A0ABR2MDM3_9ASPA
MLTKRNRTAQDHSKGRLMRDLYTNSSTDSATDQKARCSSLFSIPGLLVSFKGSSEPDSTRSPTSPLDYRIFSNLANSFIRSPRSPGRSWDCSRVGLGLVDSLGDDNVPGHSETKNILLGSQLRLNNITNSKKILNLAGDEQLETKNQVFDGFMDCLSASEDYTCITSHGPNPKTTHLFGDRILESRMIHFGKKQGSEGAGCHWIIRGSANSSPFPSNDFLSSCDLCSKKLEEEIDIDMCRGDKQAFCSSNCREQAERQRRLPGHEYHHRLNKSSVTDPVLVK